MEAQRALLAALAAPTLRPVRRALEAALPLACASELFLSAAGLDDTLAPLVAGLLPLCPAARWLHLSYNKLEAPGAELIAQALPMMHSLDAISLAGNNIGHAAVSIVKNLPRYVTQIDFRECGIVAEDLPEMFEVLANSKEIISIDLSGNSIGNKGLEIIASYVPRFTKLLYLHCANCGASRTVLKTFVDKLAGLPDLKALDISGNDIGSAFPGIVESLCKIRRLSFLGLKDGKISTENFTLLFNKLGFLRSIKRILISGNRINPRSLETLDTSGLFITDEDEDLCPDGE